MPMNQQQAFSQAERQFGFDAVVGRNGNYRKTYHVGELVNGVWVRRGVGDTVEEAFDRVEPYPDGKLPVTHGARHKPDR